MASELEMGLDCVIHCVSGLGKICLPQFPHTYKERSKIFYVVLLKQNKTCQAPSRKFCSFDCRTFQPGQFLKNSENFFEKSTYHLKQVEFEGL